MAKCGRTNAGGGGGIGSDELTALKEYVLNTYTAVTSDSDDEKGIGTMPDNRTTTSNSNVPAIDSNRSGVPTRLGSHLQYTTNTSGQKVISISPPKGYYPGDETSFVNRPASDFGDATVNHVLSGHTFTSQDGLKLPGSVVVNSLLSFSVAAYSGRRVLAKWQNPKAAIGKPYSGVYIRYSTSGYPGKTGGTQIYKGTGNNTASQGESQTYLDLPAIGTTYYLSCIPYVTCSTGELIGEPLNTAVTTNAPIYLTMNWTQDYVIPIGYTMMDIFGVGAGGGGGDSKYDGYSGGGAGGGYTKTVKHIAVSSGQVLNIIVGAGGIHGTNGQAGGASEVYRSGVLLISAAGGNCVGYDSMDGGNGGSGGGDGGALRVGAANGHPGGTDGGDGDSIFQGKGQGTTTRAFGEPSGALFSGGGAGGAPGMGGGSVGGKGGVGGGGNGGATQSAGAAGVANTGGGGGGAGYAPRSPGTYPGGNGGSGVVLIRLY